MKQLTLFILLLLLLSCTGGMNEETINNAVDDIQKTIQEEFNNLKIPEIPDYPNLILADEIIFDNTLDLTQEINIDLTGDAENYLCYFSFININPVDLNLLINDIPIIIPAQSYKNEFLILNFEKNPQISTFNLLNCQIRLLIYLY